MLDEQSRRSAEAIEKIQQLSKNKAILWLASNRTHAEINTLLAFAQAQLGEASDYINVLLGAIIDVDTQEILLSNASKHTNNSIYKKLAEVAQEALKQQPGLVN